MNLSDEWIAESELLERSGLNIEELRRARNGRYKNGADWVRNDRRIFWHKAAATRLCGTLGIEVPLEQKSPGLAAQCTARANSEDAHEAIKAPEQKKAPIEPMENGLVALSVWRGPGEGIKNSVMVEAVSIRTRPTKREDIVRVLVGDNRRFRRDMEILAKHREADLYELAKGGRTAP